MVVLVAVPAPTFLRAIEQSKLDVAAANLRSVWNAQRFFYLENKRYGSLAELAAPADGSDGLVDVSIASGATFYAYSLAPSADGQSFVASATHPAGSRCVGDDLDRPDGDARLHGDLRRCLDDAFARADPVRPTRPRRRGATFLEIQVAMLVLCVALAGVCPLVVMQSRMLRRLESPDPASGNAQLVRGVRMLDGAPYVGPGQAVPGWSVLQPEPDAWVRRLGTAATFRSDAPPQGFTPMPVQAQADDADPTFTAAGWLAGVDPSAVGGAYHWLPADGGAGPAAWSLAGVNPGRYHVLVSWVPSPQNAKDATFTIGNGSTQVGMFIVDQTVRRGSGRVGWATPGTMPGRARGRPPGRKRP